MRAIMYTILYLFKIVRESDKERKPRKENRMFVIGKKRVLKNLFITIAWGLKRVICDYHVRTKESNQSKEQDKHGNLYRD